MSEPLNERRAPRKSLISRDWDIMSGAYCIRGTRLPARFIKAMHRGGDSIDHIMKNYGHLTRAQVVAAIKFRAKKRAK